MSKNANFTILKLERNSISSINESAFIRNDVINLWRFSLKGNLLAKLPEFFFRDFENLKELDLAENLFDNFSTIRLDEGKKSVGSTIVPNEQSLFCNCDLPRYFTIDRWRCKCRPTGMVPG